MKERFISLSLSILNCGIVSQIADRTYVYDNSVEDSEATLLFRLSEGKLIKQYVSEVPAWAEELLP